jgi:hypothetical protein
MQLFDRSLHLFHLALHVLHVLMHLAQSAFKLSFTLTAFFAILVGNVPTHFLDHVVAFADFAFEHADSLFHLPYQDRIGLISAFAISGFAALRHFTFTMLCYFTFAALSHFTFAMLCMLAFALLCQRALMAFLLVRAFWTSTITIPPRCIWTITIPPRCIWTIAIPPRCIWTIAIPSIRFTSLAFASFALTISGLQSG